MASSVRVLMCPPRYYDVSYQINPWMDKNQKVDPEKAGREWHALYQIYTRDLGIEVDLIDPVEDLPDMVFTSNAGLVHQDIFVPSRFRYQERRRETVYYVRYFREKGYQIKEIPSDLYFEGQGDALFYQGMLFAGYLTRSDVYSHLYLGEYLNRRVISLELVDPKFYHLDTCFCPLNDTHVLYFPEAFDRYGRKVIENFVDYPISLTKEEAFRFCCNAVTVGRKIIMAECPRRLQDILESIGFEVITTCVSEFTKAGGSVKCLTLVLESP